MKIAHRLAGLAILALSTAANATDYFFSFPTAGGAISGMLYQIEPNGFAAHSSIQFINGPQAGFMNDRGYYLDRTTGSVSVDADGQIIGRAVYIFYPGNEQYFVSLDPSSDPANYSYLQSFFNPGVVNATGITTIQRVGPITSAPEPASWALMISGFGIAGGALRRSRKLRATSVKASIA